MSCPGDPADAGGVPGVGVEGWGDDDRRQPAHIAVGPEAHHGRRDGGRRRQDGDRQRKATVESGQPSVDVPRRRGGSEAVG